MRNDREKLQDILEAIERIDRYAVQGRQAFEQNELILRSHKPPSARFGLRQIDFG